ncbi:MAG: glycerophosphodiester phosphodiesterase family protein [Actinomycetota bacterium]
MNLRSATLGAVLIVLAVGLGACGSDLPRSDPAADPPAAEGHRVGDLPTGFDVQGHRGARGLKPESTLPGFEKALDLGVTTLELDLHYTADGDVIVWHDPVIDPGKCRRPDGSDAAVPDPDDPIASETELAVRALAATTLRSLMCDRNPNPDRFPRQNADPTALAGNDFGIVTLGELFAFVDEYAGSDAKTAAQRDGARTVRFNIETKRNPQDPAEIGDGFDGVNVGPFESQLLEVIDGYGFSDRVVIQSFDRRSLEAIHRADPTIPLAALTVSTDDDLAAYARLGISIWSPRAATVNRDRIEVAHAVGLAVVPWTVNDPEEMARLIDAGVDGLITDRPDLLNAER